MNRSKIEQVQMLNTEIENFRSCYKGSELWGEQDGPVKVETLIEFLIENPHFQQIADKISELNKS
jgi:hypothetical protein